MSPPRWSSTRHSSRADSKLQSTLPATCMTLLRAEVRGIPAANDLESLQCVHVGIQGTRSRPTIQGHCKARRIPGSQVLTVVLVRRGGVGRPALFPARNWNLLCLGGIQAPPPALHHRLYTPFYGMQERFPPSAAFFRTVASYNRVGRTLSGMIAGRVCFLTDVDVTDFVRAFFRL